MRRVGALLAVVMMLALVGGWGSGGESHGLAQQGATPAPVPGIDAAATAHLGGRLPGNPQIQLVKVAGGLNDPTNVAFPNDGSGRMFVAERAGTIRIVEADGTVRPGPFLDVTDRVSQRPGEQGFLGLAFHPDYKTNGLFYVDYTDVYSAAVYVSEFRVSANDPNVADPRSERLVLKIDKPFPAHNGGTIKFGPDGYLYIAVGDGGWQGDPFDNAQSRFTLLGKILRIDVNGSGPGRPYGIPPDNPFAGPDRYDNPYPGSPPSPATGTPAAGGTQRGRERERGERTPGQLGPAIVRLRPPIREEIWALGFRNPWQFAFDPKTGDAYIGDVGGSMWEEIDFQPAGEAAGQNYGWDWLEGTHCYPEELTECPRQQVGVLPVAEYQHGDDGCAVVGIGVYRGEAYPSLDGIYFSADFCTGKVRGLERDDAGQWVFQDLLDTATLITGAGQDQDGNLYVTTRGQASREQAKPENREDSVWKIVSADKVPPGAETAPLGGENEGAAAGEGEQGVFEGGGKQGRAPAAATPAEEGAPAATPAPKPAKPARNNTLTIAMNDMYFAPAKVEIPANTDVRVSLPNEGATAHNFSIDELNISVDVEVGETGEATINAPPGKYRFYCNVPGHRQAGMIGTLVVK